MSVTNEITNAANTTAQMQAAQNKAKGAASANMTSNDFLTLMMKQLQYQDPMDPMDNSQFIAQQAQFTQLSTTQEMSKNIATNNSIMQTLSLVGKNVTLTDPNNPTKTISGVVSEAAFTQDGAAIVVNGKAYPIALVQSVKDASAAAAQNSNTTNTSGNTGGTGSTTNTSNNSTTNQTNNS